MGCVLLYITRLHDRNIILDFNLRIHFTIRDHHWLTVATMTRETKFEQTQGKKLLKTYTADENNVKKLTGQKYMI